MWGPIAFSDQTLLCTCSGTRPWLHGTAVQVGSGSPSPRNNKWPERSFTEISIASSRPFLRYSVAQITTPIGFRSARDCVAQGGEVAACQPHRPQPCKMANRRIRTADRGDLRASRAATSQVCLSVGAIACRAAPWNIATASAYVHTRNTCRSTRGQAFVTNDSTISDLSSPPSWSSPDGASGVQTNCNRRSFVYDAMIKDVENIGHSNA
ncbi:hypothetical protein BC826DRAFT_269291 [Russula brevipes]|nr:hypothetical protein BC826DRAFT_269291 [Russula brevipes]